MESELNVLFYLAIAASFSSCSMRTPFTILVPIRVTKPLTLSERSDERTSVEPGSAGASNFTHSSKPSFKAAKEDCNEFRYHCSSLAYAV